MRLLLDWLFPIRSLTGGEGEWVTSAERETLSPAPLTIEGRGMGLRSLDRVIGAAKFRDVPLLCRTLHLWKYRRVRALTPTLSAFLFAAMPLVGGVSPITLCPVPLHWSRRFWRGFNQCELLARELSSASGWPTACLLRRSRSTGTQVGRGRAERMTAMRSAFRVIATDGIPERVLLVDDVVTTGATLDACAAALKESGVRIVEAIVLAVD